MGRRAARPRYAGYRSFSYLEPGVDFRAFQLAPELGRVPAYDQRLTPEQEARVERILAEYPIISLHDHIDVIPQDPGEILAYIREGRDFTGYEGLAVSGLDAVFENFQDGTALITSKSGWKWEDVIADIGMRYSDWAHQDLLIRAERVDDIFRAKANGQIAVIPSLEAATPIENELDRIDVLYGLGIRCMGIAYSEANALGGGLREPVDGGLTRFGRQAVRRMNQLGIAIDISHCGDRTSLDVMEFSEKPVFITHAGARALWNARRLKPDDVIRACAEKGGVIGIEAAPHTTITRERPRHTLESVMQHFEYCVELVGIDHVAFGPDTMFGDHVGLHRAFAAHLSIGSAHSPAPFPEVEYVEGLENPGEAFPRIVGWLVQHGYPDDAIARAVGGNVLRVLSQVWV